MNMCMQTVGVSYKAAMEARFMLGRAGPIADIAKAAMNDMLSMPSERLRANLDVDNFDRPEFKVPFFFCVHFVESFVESVEYHERGAPCVLLAR